MYMHIYIYVYIYMHTHAYIQISVSVPVLLSVCMRETHESLPKQHAGLEHNVLQAQIKERSNTSANHLSYIFQLFEVYWLPAWKMIRLPK